MGASQKKTEGLLIVHTEGKILLGRGSPDEEGPYLLLRETIELGVQRSVDHEGRMVVQMYPVFVVPFDAPHTIRVRPSLIARVTDEKLEELHRSVAHPSSVVPAKVSDLSRLNIPNITR